MFRSRLARVLALFAGLGLVMYVVISLFLPSSRRLIVGIDKSTGSIRLVRSHVTFLPPHQFYRLDFDKREGAAQRDGFIRIVSQEGVPVTITYRLRFNIAGDRIADARTLVREGWSAWIRRRVGEAVAVVAQKVPIEELLSPTSQFAQQRDRLRQVVAGHLARSGLQVTAFEIARVEADREALLNYKRAELRRSARGVAGRVAIFAIDGADWELISELADDDRIPNLRALARGGVTGSVQTIQPTVSPLVWTTMATGVTPDRHGVIDFFDRANKRPVDALTRRAPALWEVAEAFGRHSVVVNWWTDWPAAPGATVTFDTPVDLIENGIYPATQADRIRNLQVPPNTVGFQQVARFLNITASEYDDAVRSNDPNDPINVMRTVLAKTWTDHRVALDLYQREKPLLMMMSYDGTDVANHLFAPYHPPYREGINEVAYRRYWPSVANYYAEVDRLIGEWMSVLTDDTTVIIVSAHGFRWGKNRPRTSPVGRAALSDHRNPGLFIAYGNHVAPNRASHPMTIYDVAPTTLAILGLPKSTEMPGQVATWAFRDIQPVESVRVVSYSEFFNARPAGGLPPIDAKLYTASLQAIGHVIDVSRLQPVFEDEDGEIASAAQAQPIAPQQYGSYAWYNNLGVQLRSQNKFKEAVEAFQKAIELNPNKPTPYLNLAMVLFDRQQYTAADEAFIQAVAKGLPNADRWFVDFAALYRTKDMTSRAIALLYKGKQIFPSSYAIAANLGSALAESERYTEGIPELERALGLQPSSTLALNNLGLYYSKKNDYGRALDFWNRSLTIDPRQPQIRQAADAARTHL
ncbi:MAG TPA: alkaline phosphatase family protein [Thermoanaerobaculia bacterium]|nr:alkaline phosphatase family protein [Thermoanaerobaculia bacterium]